MRNTFVKLLTPRLSILTSFLFGILFISCNQHKPENKNVETRLITDMLGRKVEVPSQLNAVVAHGAGALRLICYLDATEFVTGIEANEQRREVPYLFAYPQLKKLPIIGSGNKADPELIAALKPDLLICTFINVAEANELQNKTGVPVICLDYGNFDQRHHQLYPALELLGMILNKEERAKKMIDYMETNFNAVASICAKETQANKVYVGGIAYRGAHGINSTEPLFAPFRIANAMNVASSLAKEISYSISYPDNMMVDKEQIIEWKPDKIFIDASGYLLTRADLEKSSVFGELLPAIQMDEIYFLLPHIWHTVNYENILINTFYVAKILHPHLFQNLNIEQKADEIYEAFLGKAIYQDMIKLYGMGCQKINRP